MTSFAIAFLYRKRETVNVAALASIVALSRILLVPPTLLFIQSGATREGTTSLSMVWHVGRLLKSSSSRSKLSWLDG